jgi:hypothetical protein
VQGSGGRFEPFGHKKNSVSVRVFIDCKLRVIKSDSIIFIGVDKKSMRATLLNFSTCGKIEWMKKTNISVKKMDQFAGKWVAILGDRVIAVGETLQDISPLVTRSVKDHTPDEKTATAFLVPFKGEGPYVL